MDKVSIIVPVYNVENYLNECIESMIQQTYKNLEIILVDDGSTDSSGMICDEYAKKDSRIKVIHKGNGGAASAKNLGLDSMTGSYFTFIDSDDTISSTRIENMMNAMLSNNVDVVEADFSKMYSDHLEVEDDMTVQLLDSSEYLNQYLDHWQCSLFWNKLFKSSLTQGIRFKKERRCIDDEFYTYKVCSNAQSIMHIHDTGYYYRQRKSSAVSNENHRIQITKDALDILIERYLWIKERFPHLAKTYYMHDVNILFYFASSFVFTKDTVYLFKKVRKFYIFESTQYLNLRLMYLLLKLMLIGEKQLLGKKEVSLVDTSNYFD